MQLVTTELQASYRVVEPFRWPFHDGSMLRGVLGRALRKAACARPVTTCANDCELPEQCTYSRLFDPPAPNPVPHRFLRGLTRAPQPMIPVFPAPGRIDAQHGAVFSITLRLLGPLERGDLAVVLEALEGLSAFEFTTDRGRIAFDHATLVGQRETPIATNIDAAPMERIAIQLETPAWLEHQGRLMERIHFQPFFRAIYRRLTVLCALYGEWNDADDAAFEPLDALAAQIVVAEHHIKKLEFQRRSEARGREHPMRGVIGRVVFEGRGLEAFLPALRLAEKTHIGKATSFGMGRMRIDVT